MIIYNVTIKVDNDVADAWVAWMKNEHLGDVLATGQFTDARLSHLLEQDESEGVTYIAQYFCENITQYQTYINEYATAMREKGFKAFGSKFAAFRTVMEIL